jgi:hypothetical protein
MANQAANPTVNQDQLIRDIAIQGITAIYSVPLFTPGAVNLSSTALQNLNSLQPVIDLKDVTALRNLQFEIEPSESTLTTSQLAAASIPDPIPPVKSSPTTESCCFSNFPSYQSKENIQKEGTETGTTSLPHPPKKGDSLSEFPDGPEGYPDNKRFERDEIKENNSFFFKSEYTAELDGAEKIPMEEEAGRTSVQQRPKKGLSISDVPVVSIEDGMEAVEPKILSSSSRNQKTACTLNQQEAPAYQAEAPCSLIFQEAPATPAEAPCSLTIQEARATPAKAPSFLNSEKAPANLAEAPCILDSEKAPANPAEAPQSLTQKEAPSYQAEAPCLHCLITKDSCIRITPADSKEEADSVPFFPPGRPAASLEALKEDRQQAAAFVNSTSAASNQKVVPKFRSPCSQATIFPEFSTHQHSLKRKRLEPVKPASQRITRSTIKKEDFIDQSFSKWFTQVPNKHVSLQLKTILVLKAIKENSSTHQSVWDPGGKLPKRVNQLSLGNKWNGHLTESGAS